MTHEESATLAKKVFQRISTEIGRDVARESTPTFWAQLAGHCLAAAYARERMLNSAPDLARSRIEEALVAMSAQIADLLPDRVRVSLTWSQPPIE